MLLKNEDDLGISINCIILFLFSSLPLYLRGGSIKMDVRRFLTMAIVLARSIRATSQPIDLALCLRAVNMQMRNRLRERFHVRNEAVTREIRRDVSWIISLLRHTRECPTHTRLST